MRTPKKDPTTGDADKYVPLSADIQRIQRHYEEKHFQDQVIARIRVMAACTNYEERVKIWRLLDEEPRGGPVTQGKGRP